MVDCCAPPRPPIHKAPCLAHRHQEARSSNLARPGVLVVDDEPSVRDVLCIGLQQQGFDVWLAKTGWEALDVYVRHVGEIAVVILDVRMHGLDGPQILKCLRHVNPLVRACFISGSFGRYSYSQLLETGAARVLCKPFPLDEIASVVRKIIEDNEPAALAS